MVVGDNGILAKAQTAKERTNKTQSEELDQLNDFEQQIDTLGRAGSKSDNYSTDEKVVGTWIDGKPLYQKVVNTTSPSDLNTWSTIYTVTDAEYLRVVYGELYHRDSSLDKIQLNYYTQALIAVKSNILKMFITENAFKSKDVLLIVQYTKTTD